MPICARGPVVCFTVCVRDQVRCSQLDKEAAELRDEVASLVERLKVADEAQAREWKEQVAHGHVYVKHSMQLFLPGFTSSEQYACL